MTAARVLNPVILTEFCKLRASPSAMGRNMTCNRQLNRIRRDLFGTANPVETQRTLAAELDKHQDRASKKWGFDFRTGSPLTTNTQYVWERISYQESTRAPEVYTLTRAAHVRPLPVEPCSADELMDKRAERENYTMINTSTTTDTDSCGDYDSQDESLVEFKVPECSGNKRAHDGSSANRPTLRKRQPKITEYMKERKRLAQTPKKVSPAAKRARTSSGSSSSNSHSAHAYSISAHFSLQRSFQRNN
ncbi:cyclin-dependent kinase inhibitor 1B [Ceratitis capitata]|uniref:cyclin-dependent kinase inhibitor 1B n=1 Tax=Ceratitis capitata TaxID=7213 RepID=UPI000329B2F1|nr:cyclin-dependent kinase inhibitor 1B [Ceratitis capitata]